MLATVALLALMLGPEDAPGPEVATASKAPARAALPSARVLDVCVFTDGQRLAFDGESRVAAELNLVRLRRAAPAYTAGMKVSGVKQQRTRLAYRLEFEVDVQGSERWLRGDWTLTDSAAPAVSKALGTRPWPLALKVDERCRVTAVRLGEMVPTRAAVGLLRTVEDLRFAVPERSDAPVEVDELIQGATVKTRYVMRPNQGRSLLATQIALRKVPNSDPEARATAPNSPFMTLVPRAEKRTVELGDAPWFKRIQGTRVSRSVKGVAETETTCLIEAAPPSAAWTAPTARTKPVDFSDYARRARDLYRVTQLEPYVGMPFDALVARLERLRAGGKDGHAEAMAMRRWLQANPKQVGAFVDAIRGNKFKHHMQYVRGVSALALSGVPEATDAVRAMMNDKHIHGQIRAQATLSMGYEVADLTEADVKQLIAYGRDRSQFPGLSQLSTTNLGAIADLREDPKLKQLALNELKRRLGSDIGPPLHDALMAASNYHGTELLASVDPHLDNPTPDVGNRAWSVLMSAPLSYLTEHFDQLYERAGEHGRLAALYEALGQAANRPGFEGFAAGIRAKLLQDFKAHSVAGKPGMVRALLAPLAPWYKHDRDPAILAAVQLKAKQAIASGNTALLRKMAEMVGAQQLAGP